MPGETYWTARMDAARIEKLRYRAWRRGIREMDLILGPFADRHAAELSPAQLDDFEELLEAPDTDLYAWIIGRTPTPEAYATEVMELVRGFRLFAHAAINPDRKGA
jgi:antitoxin CptB